MSEQRVIVSRNGPYLVYGGIPLGEDRITVDTEGVPTGWRTVKQYPSKERYALYRCGQSGHKPQCDGTHVRMRIDGTVTASREPYLEQTQEINGPNLILTDAQGLCSVARFCHRAGGIWNLTLLSYDPVARQVAIEIAANCPSGRLVVWDRETLDPIEPMFEKAIGVTEGPGRGMLGPLWLRGGITLESADGTPYEVRNRVTVCRCGGSENKPLCDGTHVSVRFIGGYQSLELG
jgi:CDGSH-type Zn-finger protein